MAKKKKKLSGRQAAKLRSKAKFQAASDNVGVEDAVAVEAGEEEYIESDISDFDDDESTADGASMPPPPRLSTGASEEECDAFLHRIVLHLRSRCSKEGQSPGDATSLYGPSVESRRHGTEAGSWFSGTDNVSAYFLDSFLYGEDEMRRCIDRGSLEIFYCEQCHRTLQGESRLKKESERFAEDQKYKTAVDAIKSRYAIEKDARHRQWREDLIRNSSTSRSSSTPSTCTPSTATTAALDQVTQSLSTLSTEATSSSSSSPPSKLLSLPEQDTAANKSMEREISLIPTPSPYRFPRHDVCPSRCRYCHAVGVHIAVRNHLTHSLSAQQSKEMFTLLVNPHVDFTQPIGSTTSKQKTAAIPVAASSSSSAIPDAPFIADVGSRLGNMLYEGLLYSNCSSFVGIEIDTFFVEESRRALRRFGLGANIKVLESDVVLQASYLNKAKLVCFFNPFELHVTREKHRELLRFIHGAINHRNQYILSCPSLHEIFSRAESDIDVAEWVEEIAHAKDAFLFRVR